MLTVVNAFGIIYLTVSKLNLSNDFIISGLVFAVTAMLKYFKFNFISGLRGSERFCTIHSSFCFNKMASSQSILIIHCRYSVLWPVLDIRFKVNRIEFQLNSYILVSFDHKISFPRHKWVNITVFGKTLVFSHRFSWLMVSFGHP